MFAGGDDVTGPASVIEAISAGERAAVGMDRFLTGADPRLLAGGEAGGYVLRPGRRAGVLRAGGGRLIPLDKRKGNFQGGGVAAGEAAVHP